jgi:hypothetical protein
MQWRTESDEANACSAQQNNHMQARAGGLGEQVRAAARPHIVDLVSRGVERSIKRRVERVERRSVHQRGGEKLGDVAEGRGE